MMVCCFSLFMIGCKQVAPPAPIAPLPQPKQVAWQKMEMYAFVHFGLNTFNDMEWGYGNTDPSIFNPQKLDCEQWVKTFVNAGLTGVILTAKHHEGFCLWQTKYTDYSVKKTPWKNRKGDVVGELAAACKKYGIKFAIYLSPWDRHHAEYGHPEYVQYYYNQLEELMTNYGDIFEVWFDGANGGDGWYGGANETRTIDRKNYYNYPLLYQLIDSLQPNAVIFGDGGPGCRWVGNEQGWANATNWSFLCKEKVYPGYENHHELQSGHQDGDMWAAAECDVSIRPGWFYHESQDTMVKSVETLTDLYYRSVGRNATLLLNFPINRDGLIHSTDSSNAVNFYKKISKELSNNLLLGMVPIVSNERGTQFSAKKLTDGKDDTYWATTDSVTHAVIEFSFKKPQKINRLLLQEYISLGQRVTSFSIEMWCNDTWKPILIDEETTTIGYKRILRFNTVETEKLRIVIHDARGTAICLNNVEAFYAE